MQRLQPSKKRPQRAICSRRGIILSIELIMVLPILLLVLLATVEFSLIANAQARIDNVAATAAQHLSASPSNSSRYAQQVVSQKLNKMLGHQLASGAFAEIDIPVTSADVGRIRLVVPMQNTTPDLLWMTGFSVRNRFLVSDAPTIRQSAELVQR